MRVTQEVKNQVNAEIRRCIAIAEKTYDRKFEFPNIVYKKGGTTAGTASDWTYTIDLNPTLLMENVEAFMKRTVPHEFAHLVDGIVSPHTRMGRKRSVHGPTWKQIMVEFGCEPSRCHTYDVSSVRAKKTRYAWVCGCGAETMTFGAKRHSNQLASEGTNSGYYVRGHSPRQCGAPYTFAGKTLPDGTFVPAEKVVEKKAADAPIRIRRTKKRTTANKTTTAVTIDKRSKLDMCRKVFANYSHKPRADMIALFVDKIGLTPAGAATYFAKIRKERNS